MKQVYDFQKEDSMIDIAISSNFTQFLQLNKSIDLAIEHKGERLIDYVLKNKQIFEIQQIIEEITEQQFSGKEIIIDFNTPDQNGKSLFTKLFEKYSLSVTNEIEGLLTQLLTMTNFLGHKIDWNQNVDAGGNSLMLAIAQNPMINVNNTVVNKFIDAKNAEGLPLFSINKTNNTGNKLIDIYKNQLDANQLIDPVIFTKLRELGSGEPKSIFVPTATKLDTANVHAPANEPIIKSMQQEVHAKHMGLDVEKNLTEIEEYINTNKNGENIISLLEGALQISALDALTHLNELKNDYMKEHAEHNNTWNARDEVAHIWQESKECGLQDLFIQKLAELTGCPWGHVVNLYQTLERNELTAYKSVLPKDKLANDDKFLNGVTDDAFL